MNAKVTAIALQKGGTAKTTTCVSLGIGLAQQGKKVLCIDGDSQGSMTIMDKEADAIEQAVKLVLQDGYRTADIVSDGFETVGCAAMGKAICARI